MLSADALVTEVCARQLQGASALNRNEMNLAGYADTSPQIDVCAGIK
jgi:hypothetical protein